MNYKTTKKREVTKMLNKSGSLFGISIVFIIFLLPCCKKQGEVEVQTPANEQSKLTAGNGETEGKGVRPVVPVPPITEYGWLAIANIKLGRENEIASVKKKIEDYYSGYPSFLKVLKIITKDRNVGLKDNPAYLTDIFNKYYELVGANPSDPFLSVQEYNAGVMKNALFLSWKKENQFSSVDNYDDMVTRVDYGGK